MTDSPGSSDFTPSTRGDAAWQEARDGVASRNATARKAGKVERETYERERDAITERLGVPCCDPVRESVATLVEPLAARFAAT